MNKSQSVIWAALQRIMNEKKDEIWQIISESTVREFLGSKRYELQKGDGVYYKETLHSKGINEVEDYQTAGEFFSSFDGTGSGGGRTPRIWHTRQELILLKASNRVAHLSFSTLLQQANLSLLQDYFQTEETEHEKLENIMVVHKEFTNYFMQLFNKCFDQFAHEPFTEVFENGLKNKRNRAIWNKMRLPSLFD